MIAVGLLGQFPSEEVAAGIKLAVLLLLFSCRPVHSFGRETA
jgi:hypothetical protein